MRDPIHERPRATALRRLARVGLVLALTATPACGDSGDSGVGGSGASDDVGGSGGVGGSTTVGGAQTTGGAGGSSTTGGAGGEGGAGGGALPGTCDTPHVLTLDGAALSVPADVSAHLATPCGGSAGFDTPSATAFFRLSVPMGTSALVEADAAHLGDGDLVLADLTACGEACVNYDRDVAGDTARMLLASGEHILQIKSSDASSAFSVRARTMNELAEGTCTNPYLLHSNDYVVAKALAPTPTGSNFCNPEPNYYGAFFAVELPPSSQVAARITCNTSYYLTADQVISCTDISPICAEYRLCGQTEVFTNTTSLTQYRMIQFVAYLSPTFGDPYAIETTRLY